MDTSRLTIGSRADISNEKQLKNSIRDEQDASCHHIGQMYKGMIAYISPLGNSWWLFRKIEKSKGHEKS